MNYTNSVLRSLTATNPLTNLIIAFIRYLAKDNKLYLEVAIKFQVASLLEQPPRAASSSSLASGQNYLSRANCSRSI